MKVAREGLEGTQVDRLVVTGAGKSDHHQGECIGYLCAECRQVDETLQQIWHEADCSLAGEHGRAFYDDLTPVVEDTTPEFDPKSPAIDVIEMGVTEGRGGLHEGEVLGFLCTCGNADETLFEVVHDEICPLSGRHPSRSRRAPPAPATPQ